MLDGAIPGDGESALFGHERGASPGGERGRGRRRVRPAARLLTRWRRALDMQGSSCACLQEQEFEAWAARRPSAWTGCDRPHPHNWAGGGGRNNLQDLYYDWVIRWVRRCASAPRTRALAHRFAVRAAEARARRSPASLGRAELLHRHAWPGNVRECSSGRAGGDDEPRAEAPGAPTSTGFASPSPPVELGRPPRAAQAALASASAQGSYRRAAPPAPVLRSGEGTSRSTR